MLSIWQAPKIVSGGQPGWGAEVTDRRRLR